MELIASKLDTIPWSNISIDTSGGDNGKLGKGSFSVVLKGEYKVGAKGRGVKVAVKVFTSTLAELSSQDFQTIATLAISEANMMLMAKSALHHVENVIDIYGYVKFSPPSFSCIALHYIALYCIVLYCILWYVCVNLLHYTHPHASVHSFTHSLVHSTLSL